MAKDRKDDVRSAREAAPVRRRTSVAGWILAVIVVLLLVFGAISYFSNPDSPQEAPDQPASTGAAQPGAAGGNGQ